MANTSTLAASPVAAKAATQPKRAPLVTMAT